MRNSNPVKQWWQATWTVSWRGHQIGANTAKAHQLLGMWGKKKKKLRISLGGQAAAVVRSRWKLTGVEGSYQMLTSPARSPLIELFSHLVWEENTTCNKECNGIFSSHSLCKYLQTRWNLKLPQQLPALCSQDCLLSIYRRLLHSCEKSPDSPQQPNGTTTKNSTGQGEGSTTPLLAPGSQTIAQVSEEMDARQR